MTQPKMSAEIRSVISMLEKYKKQLLARHEETPLKSPPVFLLNLSIGELKKVIGLRPWQGVK